MLHIRLWQMRTAVPRSPEEASFLRVNYKVDPLLSYNRKAQGAHRKQSHLASSGLSFGVRTDGPPEARPATRHRERDQQCMPAIKRASALEGLHVLPPAPPALPLHALTCYSDLLH